MYVCVCKGITDHQIKAAVYEGATTLSQLRRNLGIASQCGKCSCLTREIVQDALSEPALVDGLPQYFAVA